MIKKFLLSIFTIFIAVLFFSVTKISAADVNVNLQVDNPSAEPPPDKIPSYLIIVSGNNQKSESRNIDPLVVKILDQNHNPLPGISINFEFTQVPAGASGYTLNPVSKISDANGIVSIDAILGNKAGIYTIAARTGTLVVYFTETYSPVVIPPPVTTEKPGLIAAKLIIVSGNNQSSESQELVAPLVVKVLDQNSSPLSNIQIDFYFSEYPQGATGYNLTPVSRLSDKDGFVQTIAKLGDKVGIYRVTAKTGSLSVNFTLQRTTKAAQSIDSTTKAIADITAPVANSAIAKAMNKPIAYTAVGWAILSPLLANAPLALPWLTYIINWFANLFNIGQKRKRWGTVYDSVSRKPVSGVDVSIFDTRYNQLVETQTTDNRGRFIINAKPGEYYARAGLEGYSFPSEYDLTGYRGKAFSVSASDTLIKINIPIDPVGKSTFKRRLSFQKFSQAFDYVYYPFLILGTLFSIAISLNRYDPTNYIFLSIYEFIWISEIIKLVRNKTFGIVYDQATRKPIDYAIVRLFNADNRKMLYTKISNNIGHYSLLVQPGHYILVSAKEGYQTDTKELRIRKESYLKENIFMRTPTE